MMSYEELGELIEEIGFPSAYYQFPKDTARPCPFICFYYPASADELADNENYVKVEQLVIELYTNNKDFAAEKAVEDVLREHELTFTRTESYLDDERMFMETYQTEVIINAD